MRIQLLDANRFVAPAQAGVQKLAIKKINDFWIPACAGMTEIKCSGAFCISLLVIGANALQP